MADITGSTTTALIDKLCADGKLYSFYQAIRLIQHVLHEENAGRPVDDKKIVSVLPLLGLGFPGNDLAKIEPLADDKGYQVTATFFGLYGVASPLPTFYTEQLIEQFRNDKVIVKDFLDIIHHSLYPMLYQAMEKYRLVTQIVEKNNPSYFNYIYSISGTAIQDVRENTPDPYALTRYAGLFSQHPRSALGLKTLLHDALGGIVVNIHSCYLSIITIAEEQRCYLGAPLRTLGECTFLGEQVVDRMNSIKLQFGPVDAGQFQQLLPGGTLFEKMAFLTRFYLITPVKCFVELLLQPQDVEFARLGQGTWSQLGYDTWLGESNTVQPKNILFQLSELNHVAS